MASKKKNEEVLEEEVKKTKKTTTKKANEKVDENICNFAFSFMSFIYFFINLCRNRYYIL